MSPDTTGLDPDVIHDGRSTLTARNAAEFLRAAASMRGSHHKSSQGTEFVCQKPEAVHARAWFCSLCRGCLIGARAALMQPGRGADRLNAGWGMAFGLDALLAIDLMIDALRGQPVSVLPRITEGVTL